MPSVEIKAAAYVLRAVNGSTDGERSGVDDKARSTSGGGLRRNRDEAAADVDQAGRGHEGCRRERTVVLVLLIYYYYYYYCWTTNSMGGCRMYRIVQGRGVETRVMRLLPHHLVHWSTAYLLTWILEPCGGHFLSSQGTRMQEFRP